MSGGGFPLPSSTGNWTRTACLMPHILMGYFIHRYLFNRLWYIIEPSFICCQMHYSHTYVLILAMTPGLDCETYCVIVSHVIPLNITAPLSYRNLILLLKEFSSVVFNFGAVHRIELQLSRESYRFIDSTSSLYPLDHTASAVWSRYALEIWQKIKQAYKSSSIY